MRLETRLISGAGIKTTVMEGGLCYLAKLGDDAEDIFLQEAVVEGEYGWVVQLRQQLGLLRSPDRLVRSKVAQRNLLQHLPARDGGHRSTRETRPARGAQFSSWERELSE